MNPTSEVMTVSCPFCGAESGQACRVRLTGKARDWPHAQRFAACEPAKPEPERRQALCCECGNLRTVSGNYGLRYRDPNYAGWGFDDKRGWRKTGTLKCGACGRQTRHALLNTTGAIDWSEKEQQFVLGGESPGEYWDDSRRDHLREQYFAQFPRNPQLHHWYWVSEAKEAWAAGRRDVTALCGAPMTLHADPPSTPGNDLVKPGRIDWDTEFEDHDTGMSWIDMECVDCLAVTNRERLKNQRDAVRTKLLEASEAIEQLDATALAAVDEYLERLIGGAK
jgi:transcription elongation factor Elf1